ncbi:MAG: serine hydrolase domain-containing protein [Bacteroidota bacterium]
MIKPIIVLVFCSLFSFTTWSQTPLTIDQEAITKLLDEYIEDDIAPGMAVGIVQDGEIVFEYYTGYANLEHQIKFDENTRSNIASTAKQFTAIMILDLAMKGQLDLEADLRDYLPDLYPNVTESIKIRHLINHTSGIRDYVFIHEMMNDPSWTQLGLDNDDVIDLLAQQEELMFKPGSKYIYSNSGYNIMANIIEQISGKSFNDYSKAFFENLGMNQTAFIEKYMGVIPNRADAYSDWGSGDWLATPTLTKSNGEGYLYTTLKDQLIFEQAVQNAKKEDNELLLKAQQPIPNSEITTYGFGLELDGRIGRNATYHSGSTFGYHSHTTRFPEENLTVFVMSNNGKIWSGYVADDVANLILPEGKKENKYDPRFSDRTENTVTLLGQYYSPKGFLIRIIQEEGKIYWKRANRNPIELLPEGKNTYAISYNKEEKVVFYDDELRIYYPSGNTDIYPRSTVGPASIADIDAFIGQYESSELDMSFEIRLAEEGQLKIKFSNRERERDLQVINRNELLASNFVLQVERDQFNRPTDVLVTLTRRAQRNRFKKESNLSFQPKIKTSNGSIQVTTIGSRNGDSSGILLTKNDPNGNEIWFKQYGGSSYDQANSILATDDGYLIIGSTSSYGNGNYDMFVIKTDKKGKQQWQKTYGKALNEYGYIAETTDTGFLLKGTIQTCKENDVVHGDCVTNVWFVSIDEKGNELSNEILEELYNQPGWKADKQVRME